MNELQRKRVKNARRHRKWERNEEVERKRENGGKGRKQKKKANREENSQEIPQMVKGKHCSH